MIAAPTPIDEDERLAELLRYEVLDTPAEEVFDRIARVAARTCGVPMALVSLVDRDRQWFKARCGLDAPETSRELSFCAHAILDAEPLVVVDAATDERFADNPLVTGPPRIRFYAGVPLCTPRDRRIGTLCVLDREPRRLEEGQLEMLETLARQVVSELELSLVGRRLRESNAELERASAAKDRLLEMAAHDVRNPVATIRAAAGLELLDAESLAAPLRESLEIIRAQSDQALGLLEELLELSGLRAGRLVLQPTTASPNPTLREAFDGARRAADAKGVPLDWQVPESLPETTFDARLIGSVVAQLLDNAIKFSAPGRLTTLGARAARSSVEVWVEDRGPGIPEAGRAALFVPFGHVGPRPTGDESSRRLGLAIAHEILGAHGSLLHVDSVVGRGSKFSFELGGGAG